MNESLKIILSLSLSGALLILILYLFRPLYRKRLSKRWQYYIWLVVIARLLLPFTPQTSLMGTLFQEIGANAETAEIVIPHSLAGLHSSQNPPHTDSSGFADTWPEQPKQEQSGPYSSLWQNLWLGWLVISLILLIRKITIYQSFMKYIRAGCTEVVDIGRLEQFGGIIGQYKIKGCVELYTNSMTATPLLIGFFHPRVVLPAGDLPASDFQYTVRHELMHYKRGDMFYKWLLQFTVCLHWFNPLVYIMSREINRTCELSCDEAVIRGLDARGRRAYGSTLLNALKTQGCYKDATASVALNENGVLLKERLDAIMSFQKKPKAAFTISFILTVLLVCAASVTGAYGADSHAPSRYPVLSGDAEFTDIDIQATIGNLTLEYGDRLQLKVGQALAGHATFSCKNGTLIYRDDLKDQNLADNNRSGSDYDIIVTIPRDQTLKKLTADVGIGEMDLQRIKAGHAILSVTGPMKLNGFSCDSLDIDSVLAEITADEISVYNGLSLRSYGSTAAVSGDIRGNVLIDSAGISNTSITFSGTDRKDYFIESKWAPESDEAEPWKSMPGSAKRGFSVNGETYDIDYGDTGTEAPYQLTILYRELMPLDNISILFQNSF